MAFVATPEGPVTIGGALEAQMRTTGYVSSVNGKQGAVTIDLGAVLPPSGTPDGNVPRAKAGGVVWKTARIDVTDWCKCDGVTDDTAAAFAMLKHAATLAASTGQCTVYNPGLPIAHTGLIYFPKYVNYISEGGGADPGVGGRFVSLGKEAQLVVHERGGKSGPWLFDGNGLSDPTPHPVTVSTTSGSADVTVSILDGVTGPADAALDALWGKVVTLSASAITGAADGLFQSVIVATPGNAGYGTTKPASGKVRLANTVPNTAGAATGWFGENVSVHFLKPSQRQFDNISVVGSVAWIAHKIDKISNATFISYQCTKNRWIGPVIGRNGAGGAFLGQTHIGGNGWDNLQFSDDLGSALLSTSRNLHFDHLICESLGSLAVHMVQQLSYGRLTFGQCVVTMNGVIPAFVNGATYSEIPQLNGVGNANIVDYGGHYYQVKKGSTVAPALTFVAGTTPDLDATHWEDRGAYGELWHFGYEVDSEVAGIGTAANTFHADSVAMQGNNSNRQYGFVLDSDNPSASPFLKIESTFYKANLIEGVHVNLSSSGSGSLAPPKPHLPAFDMTPSTPLIGGAGAGGFASLSTLTGTGPWLASHAYGVGDIVRLPTGGLAYCTDPRTSRSTFDATERNAWTFMPGGHYEKVTASGAYTWKCPLGISQGLVRLIGGFGGGGGGGTGHASTQVGGAGGGAGTSNRYELASLTPAHSYSGSVGAGGAGGAGGASGGNAGTAGSAGGTTTFVDDVPGTPVTYSAVGGAGGNPGAATSNANALPGAMGGGSTGSRPTVTFMPGAGGLAQSTQGGAPMPAESVIGGGAGGPASATLGGVGGNSRQAPGASVAAANTNTGNTTGGNGVAPAAGLFAGGAGGGGGAPGGAAGAGSAGNPGCFEIWY